MLTPYSGQHLNAEGGWREVLLQPTGPYWVSLLLFQSLLFANSRDVPHLEGPGAGRETNHLTSEVDLCFPVNF